MPRREIDVPAVDNVGTLADFFDRTDTEELEWEDASLEFRKPDLVHVSVRITRDDLAAIKRAARKAGVGYTTYIRMILRRAVEAGQ